MDEEIGESLGGGENDVSMQFLSRGFSIGWDSKSVCEGL
jgi:hypothetical protein